MLRMFFGAFLGLALIVGGGLADEAKGKVKKVEKGVMTVTVDGKDREFKISKEAKVLDGDTELKGKERGKFLKELKEDSEVVITFDKDGDKITVKEVKIKKK